MTLTVDGQTLPPVRGVAKKTYTARDRNRGTDAVNIVIPKDRFPSSGDSSHTLTAAVEIVSPDIVDADLTNNTSAPQTFTLKQTQVLSILYVSLDKSLGKTDLVDFAARAHNFLDKVYPVSYSWGFVGTQYVSYYLVSPYIDFMKSLDPDDLPFKLGDIGIVAGGVEAGKSFSYKAAIAAVEKARRLYNTQRCKDPQGNLILPCPDEVALHAVGVYPTGAFGATKDGFAYTEYRDTWRAAANDQVKPKNVAHELGHLFGFDEEYSNTSAGIPVTGSTWDGMRFQTADGSCVNIMGNAGLLACSWINAQTWNRLIEGALQGSAPDRPHLVSLTPLAPSFAPLATEVQSPALLIEGVVTSAGVGFLQGSTAVDRHTQPPQSSGQFTLEARDSSGNALGAVQFDGLFFDLDVNPISISPFFVTLPVADSQQVSTLVLATSDGGVIHTLARSAAPPQVSFDPLPAAIQGQTTLSWQASDADGDPLLSTLYYSNNGGLSWQVLGMDMPVTSYELDPTELPGGEGIFKVSVSDGFNSAQSLSAPVRLPDQPPIVTLVMPWGTEFENAAEGAIEAVAYDLEDGLLPPEAIQWFDAQGNPLGQGTRLQTPLLAAGNHQITAQAQDSSGQVGEAKVNITIATSDSATPSANSTLGGFYPLGGCLCLLLLLMLGGAAIFLFRRRKHRGAPLPSQHVQDAQGRWWSQDQASGTWSVWNGQAWQPVPEAAPPASPPPAKPRRKAGSCLLSLFTGGGVAALVAGGISLVALNFFPGTQISMGTGDLGTITKQGGGGALLALVGLLLLNGGFKAIATRRAVVEDEWGNRREKRGCGAVLNGLGQVFFGTLLLTAGVGMATLVFYQEVLPWLGF